MRHVARALLCALAIGAAVTVADAPPVAAAESRAVVVIDTSQGSRRTVITFSGSITGIKALELAGASPVTYGFAGQGAAVCALDGVGHAANDGCLGTPSDPRYWAYFRAPDGAGGWAYSNQCACTTTVRDGDVEGWRFGTGQQPPFVSFCDVAGCAPPPTSSSTPTPAPAPAPAPGGSSTPGGGATVSPGTAVVPNPGDSGTSEPEGDVTAPTTSPSSPPTSVERRSEGSDASDGEVRSAVGLPRVADDDGSGSPWGVIVAVVVVAVLGAVAVMVRRRRSTA
jgi:hypothetical protein